MTMSTKCQKKIIYRSIYLLRNNLNWQGSYFRKTLNRFHQHEMAREEPLRKNKNG